MLCRNCHQETGDEVLVDLGSQPIANRLWDRGRQERYYPLAPVICKNRMCRLIQLPSLPPETFFGPDYPYRSGQSADWRVHLQDLVHNIGVRAGDEVWEIGGNDGSMERFIPFGAKYVNLDPSGDGALPNLQWYLTEDIGRQFSGFADYVVALNVAAHVPNLDDFFEGARLLLRDEGTLVVEVQDVNQLIERGEWDCIYHEHYSYFNRQTLADAIERRGFYVASFKNVATHGGSIRITAHPIEDRLLAHPLHKTPLRLPKPYPKWPEEKWGTKQFDYWQSQGKRVVGYGAAAKAITFLNRWGVSPLQMDYLVDTTPAKQGRFTPGGHIPIHGPEFLRIGVKMKAVDIVVILAWNWVDEILPKIPEGPEVWCRGERIR